MVETSQVMDLQEILVRARAGDLAAESVMFEHLHARVLALAKKRIWDEETARDLTQDTMSTAFAKYREADLSYGLLPWVFTILHHKVGNLLKRRRRDHWAGVFADRDESTSNSIRAFDLADAIEKGLRRATPECRKTFRLLLAGANRVEIQSAFGNEPAGTTYSRISRCREKLLSFLESLDRP